MNKPHSYVSSIAFFCLSNGTLFDSALLFDQFFRLEDPPRHTIGQINRNLLGFSSHLSKDGEFLLFGAPMFMQQMGFIKILIRQSDGPYERYGR